MPLYQKEIFMPIAVNKIVKGKGNAPCVYIGALAVHYMNSDEIQHANSELNECRYTLSEIAMTLRRMIAHDRQWLLQRKQFVL